MKLRLFDYIVLLLALGAIAAVSLYAYSGSSQPESVRIQGGEGEWIYPLDQDTRVLVRGPLGVTEVVIAGGAVRVIDSPCAEKICIITGAVSRPGAWIACLPNQVFVRVTGKDEQGVDATAF
jgi:hypothetical protein